MVSLARFDSIVQQHPELEQARQVMNMDLHLLEEAWAGEDDTHSVSWCPPAGQGHFEKTADRRTSQLLLQLCCLAERCWRDQLVQQVAQGRLCFQSWTNICLVKLVAETGLVLRSASVLQARKCNTPLPLQT